MKYDFDFLKEHRQYRRNEIESMKKIDSISVGISSEMAMLRDEEISSDENYWKYLFSIAKSYMNNKNQ